MLGSTTKEEMHHSVCCRFFGHPGNLMSSSCKTRASVLICEASSMLHERLIFNMCNSTSACNPTFQFNSESLSDKWSNIFVHLLLFDNG